MSLERPVSYSGIDEKVEGRCYIVSVEQYPAKMTRKDWQKKRKKMSGREGPKKGKVR